MKPKTIVINVAVIMAGLAVGAFVAGILRKNGVTIG